ncbi:MAG: hypothetical protein D8M58_11940 [Calditrichaeota bacterium]|nr:MAG: hypothetical protein DWQ03_12725 [Calditrichota bacterium]MBL1206107.1 hypothetical protein [Calditrichota bacterium]
MVENIFFYVGLAFILVHEMDAIRCREWRIFPGLSLLNDDLGFKIFAWAHLPIFFILFWGLSQQNIDGLVVGLDIFFIVHVALHLLFLLHKNNEFKDWLSWALILGAGFFGSLDLFFK